MPETIYFPLLDSVQGDISIAIARNICRINTAETAVLYIIWISTMI